MFSKLNMKYSKLNIKLSKFICEIINMQGKDARNLEEAYEDNSNPNKQLPRIVTLW
jgi:hypothetical protein